MNNNSNSSSSTGAASMPLPMAMAMRYRPPFTPAQWQELEQQALIYKYMMTGVPVPHELLIPIKRSFDTIMASRFYHQHHPAAAAAAAAMGYCSLYGKKLDPEPGRCRRTDGKKWRCSKDAYPDSKYCDRHMHRGRNRSRKPVETTTTTTTTTHQSRSSSYSSPSSSSTLTALNSVSATTTTTNPPTSGTFQNFPIHAISGVHGTGSSSQLHMGTGSYGMANRGDHRYPYGAKNDVDEHSFFSEASGNVRGLNSMDSSLDSSWRLMPSSQISSFPVAKESNESLVPSNNYPHEFQNVGQVTISSLPKPQQQQQQYSFFGGDFGSSEPVKNIEGQSLRPFFDEWPKSRDSWSDLEDDRSNRTSFSTTQLSISIPMASSDFSTTRSRSPNDD